MWDIKACHKGEEGYPKSLQKVDAAPETLYYVGDISVCDSVVIGVIGKREAQERHLQIARRIGRVLAREGCTVLNGLALGCDTEASEGAVEGRGKVIAVMPCGLDEIYPKRNRKLAERILEYGGCILSEYPKGTHPERYKFVQRDRIQAILSNKVLVVDAERKGGTMHTAEYALRYERPLGCFFEDGRELPTGNQYLIDSNRASAVSDTPSLMEFVGQAGYEQMSLF